MQYPIRNNVRLTPFEWKVLDATMKIPLGETRTYQWVARKVGSPKAVRAVGQALKKNPYPLLVPCHRVIQKSGKTGGYSGGKTLKPKLIDLERSIRKAMTGAL